MQSQRWAWTHTYAVPLFVTSLVALLLVGAGWTAVLTGWTAVLMFNRDADDPTDSGAAAGQNTPTPGLDDSPEELDDPVAEEEDEEPTLDSAGEIDPCVVGLWELVEHSERLEALGGSFVLTGEGPLVEYRADGSATSDYGVGTAFEIDIGLGDALLAEVAGQVHYRYEASGGTMRYSDVQSEATLQVELFGSPYQEQFSYSTAPFSYECDGDTLLFHNNERSFTARLERY